MENGLTLKIYKMNYEFLIKNYLDRAMWERQWTLFEYKQYKVTMNIWSIMTRTEQISLDIRLHYVNENGYSDYKERTVSFSLKIEDITFLKRQINSAIFDLMVMVERETVIMKTDYCDELYDMKCDEKQTLKKLAEEFLDNANVTNDNLREAYVDAFIDEYAKVPQMIADYVQSRTYKELPDLYLTWLSCLEDDPKKEIRTKEIQNVLDNDEYEKVMEEVEEYKKYMQTEDYEEEMKNNLEEI